MKKKPCLVIVGRSNSGKSSLINSLFQKKVCSVSQRPGHTRKINRLPWRLGWELVDLPGYGYAQRSKGELKLWKKEIESFLFDPDQNLRGLILTQNIKRPMEVEESQILDLARFLKVPIWVVLTKRDQVSKRDLDETLTRWKKITEEVYAVSNRTGEGLEDLIQAMTRYLKSDKLKSPNFK